MGDLKLPKVGDFVRGSGILLSIEQPPPPPPPPVPPKDYIFEEQEARRELRLNGEVIEDIQTLNDFYGLSTGVKSAIKEMKEYAAERKITPQSDVEVVVILVKSQHRARPSSQESFYNKGFLNFDSMDWKETRDLPALPEPVETIAWSSKQEGEKVG